MAVRRDIVHPPHLQRLKVGCRMAIDAAGTTQQAAAAADAYQQRMSDCRLTNTDAWLRVDEALALEDVTVGLPGWPAVTRALCAHHGGVFLPLPAADVDGADWHRAIAGVTKEFADIVAPLLELLSDGNISGREVRLSGIRGEIGEAQERLAQLDALCALAERSDSG